MSETSFIPFNQENIWRSLKELELRYNLSTFEFIPMYEQRALKSKIREDDVVVWVELFEAWKSLLKDNGDPCIEP